MHHFAPPMMVFVLVEVIFRKVEWPSRDMLVSWRVALEAMFSGVGGPGQRMSWKGFVAKAANWVSNRRGRSVGRASERRRGIFFGRGYGGVG